MAKKKKASARRSTRRHSEFSLNHSHPIYGYIAVGFVFVVLVFLLAGLNLGN